MSRRPSRFTLTWLLAGFVGLLTGCGQGSARFHINMIAMTKNKVTEEQQQQIANILTAMFGTPDDPYAPPDSGLDLDKLKRASGPVHRDATGGAKGLYREHCVHCHGITGDGAGPTAAFLNPYPRDYREGWYKWKSTKRDNEPTIENLMHTLFEGVPGTAMPSFKLMSELDRQSLVEYVKYLSIRGQVELALAQDVKENLKDTDPVPDDRSSLIERLQPIVKAWNGPTQAEVRDRPADMRFDQIADPVAQKKARDFSVAMGRQLFTHDKAGDFEYPTDPADPKSPRQKIQFLGAGCAKCHGPTGLGDGTTDDFDEWTKDIWDKARWDRSKEIEPGEVLTLGALPKRNAIPRNLRLGVYRGGRRPLDIYYRIHEGIKGVPMPQVAVLYTPAEIEPLQRAAEQEFAKSSPEPTKNGGESDADFKARSDKWNQQRKAFVDKKVEPAKEDLQTHRMWNLVDYVLRLPYEPGGELGADAEFTDVGHGELHAR